MFAMAAVSVISSTSREASIPVASSSASTTRGSSGSPIERPDRLTSRHSSVPDTSAAAINLIARRTTQRSMAPM